MTEPGIRTVHANGVEFGILEAGAGPLALCLHGFPDTAHGWRYLLPELADAGFHAVAPFMRGYAPDRDSRRCCYQLGALVADATELHEVLGGDGDAVLIGHDWGAEAAYWAAAFAPERWRRLVTLSIPPLTLDSTMFGDYEQLKRFFYIFYFQACGSADDVVWKDRLAFLTRLWNDWSPGYDASADLAFLAASLNQPTRLTAAIEYYRASGQPPNATYERQHAALSRQPPQPTLYLHGATDGCISPRFASGAEAGLAAGSQVYIIDRAGHFLHLERPRAVNKLILSWVAG